MTEHDGFGPGRRTAIRNLLVEAASKPNPRRMPRPTPSETFTRTRRRLWAGSIALGGLGVLGGVAAVASGNFLVPGEDRVTELVTPVVASNSGTAVIDLGPAPEGTTDIALELTCLTSGYFVYEDLRILSCLENDGGLTGSSFLPRKEGQTSVTVQTAPDTRWEIVATYVNRTPTDWAVNDNGQTYGAANENGMPDLLAVEKDDGTSGYVYVQDLFGTDGQPSNTSRESRTITVSLYDSTGQTIIGDYTIAI